MRHNNLDCKSKTQMDHIFKHLHNVPDKKAYFSGGKKESRKMSSMLKYYLNVTHPGCMSLVRWCHRFERWE